MSKYKFNRLTMDQVMNVILTIGKGGGMAQLVSYSPLMLRTWVQIPVVTPMHA